ncbi:MAG TPA: SdrD B-like domain-containing protein, partial [Thermoflexales bacterium]|nr:SdrD B-like domain-containing protein [Thermoflexales bacterium]
MRFDNTSATDTGFGPYVNLELPNGADGNDGLTFNNATYLGQALTPVITPFTCSGGSYTHPLTGLPTACTTGKQVVVLQLPFGSFTASQPPADIQISTKLSNLADVSTPLPINASAGFMYGCDALNNSANDPPITSSISSQSVTPTVLRASKTYIGVNEDETATGPNYPRQYRLDISIAPGQTITNLRITDTLANNMAFLSVVSIVPSGSVVQSPPVGYAASPSNLVVNFPAATNSASVIFQYFIPLTASTGSNVLPVGSGADATSTDTLNASGSWKPIDTRDSVSIAVSNPATHTLTDQALVLQKSAQVITDTNATGATPGDTVEYTLNFQVSDFVTLNNLVISDTLQDGMRFVPGSAVWTFAERGATQVVTYTAFPSSNTTQDNTTACGVSFLPSGATTLNFYISDALSSTLGLAGSIAQGGYAISPTAGATFGVLKFQAKICDSYSNLYGGSPVEMYEYLRNTAVISGQVLANAAPYTPTGNYSSDGSSATVQVPGAQLGKTLYTVNGSAPTSPLRISPGDNVTYRLVYTKSAPDYDSLLVADFLPLPIFDATTVTSFIGLPGSSTSTAPPVGSATYGPSNTFAGTNPTISTNGTANSVNFTFGPNNDPANLQNIVDILFTVKVKTDPFADDLYLTNLANGLVDNNEKAKVSTSSITQVRLNEPKLSIRKGVIATNRTSTPAPAPVFSPNPPLPAGVTYTSPGSCPAISGAPITTTRLGTAFTSDLTNLDAGDRATYAIVIQNTGHYDAWDVIITDALPSTVAFVPGSLCVQDGSIATHGSSGNLFGSGLTLSNGPTGAIPAGLNAAETINSTGTNIIIVTFDVTTTSSVQPGSTLPNTATLASYSNSGGGQNFAPDRLSDSANISSRAPTSSKVIASTEISTTGNNNIQAAIGEIITYAVSINMPEGTMRNVRITDTLAAGLAFVDCVGVSAPTDVSSNLGAINTANFCNDGAAGNPVISAVSGQAGRQAIWSFGNLTNINALNTVTETLIITYTAVVLDTAANVAAQTRANSMSFTADGVSAQTAAQTITIVEPRVSIAKSLTPNTVVNSTPVDFDITVQNTSGVDSWDTVVTDTIPSIFTSLSIASVVDTAGIVSASNFNLSGNNLNTTTPFSMTANPARTITIRIHAIANGIVANTFYTNTANTQWTSLPGAPGTRSTYIASSTERTGAGGVDNYAASSSVGIDVTTSPFKGITTTSEIHTSGTDVAIGEIVRYRIGITMPQATSPNLQFVDILPAGMQFVNDGTTTVGFISDAGMSSTSLGASPDVVGSSAILPISYPMPAGNIAVSPSGAVVTFSLGTVSNNDLDPNDEFIIVEFNALVLNTPSNIAGTTLQNIFTHLQTGLTISSSTSSVRVVEPQVSITKTIDPPAPLDAGDLITYRVHVAASVLPTSTAAFDVALTDAVDANLQIISANMIPSSAAACTSVPKTSSQNISGQVVTGYVSCLNTAETADLVIVAQVMQLAKNGLTIPNTATLAYNTLPGSNGTTPNPTGSTTTGASGTLTGERTYTGSASASTTLTTPQIAKLQPSPTQYTIGAVIAYTLVITLPEGTTANLIVEDDLPAGLGYAGYSIDYSAYNGTNTTPSVSPAPIGGTGDNPIFAFGDQQTTADNTTTNNTFRIIVLAKVLDESANVSGIILTNTAKLTYTDPTSGTTTLTTPPVSVQLVEPKLLISKAAVGQHSPLNGGDLVTYTLTVSNTGSSSAYDVVITDALPAGITYLAPIAYSVSAPAGAILTNTNTSGSSNLTWQASEIGTGATANIQFMARVAYDIAPSLTLTNTTAATYTSLPGVVSEERTVTTPVAIAVLQTGQPILELTKSVTPTIVLPGGYITYTIRVTNTGVVSAVTTITDLVPVNTTFVAATNGATGASAGSGAGTLVTWNPAPINANGGTFTAQMIVQVNSTPNAILSSITGYQVVNTAVLSGVNVITPTGTVTSTITMLRLGNRVWFDTNDNSVLDGSESGIANVVVELRDGAGNPVNNPLSGLPYIVTTDANGYYTFSNLAAGDYIVRLSASNFAAGGATPSYRVSDALAAPDPDNDIDNDNNGISNPGGYVQSLPITLAYGAEPGTTLALSDTNSTVDFGLWYPSAVRMEKRASNINPSAGGSFTYYLEIVNPGPTTAKNTVITDTLPAGLSLIGVDYANSYTLTGNTLVINVGSIDPGVTRTVNVNVLASSTLTNATLLTNTAVLTSPNAIATITDTAVVEIRNTADIRLTKFGKPDGNVMAGDRITYTLVAFNQGPDVATNLILTDTIATSGGPFVIVSA